MSEPYINIATLLPWGAPKPTFDNAPTLTRKALAPHGSAIWKHWAQNKATLKGAGIHIYKTGRGWMASWTYETPEGRRDTLEAAASDELRSGAIKPSPGYTCPAPEGMKYKPFQLAGVEFVARRIEAGDGGSLIADEPGLGKTIQALGVINQTDPRRTLIVCPASVRLNWQAEAERWLVGRRRVYQVGKRGWGTGKGAGVYIINYDILDKHRALLRDGTWDLVVLDEGHAVSNPATIRHKALFDSKDGRMSVGHWLFLTGTPLMNKPVDLHTFGTHCSPGLFPSYPVFAVRYNGAKGEGAGVRLGRPTNTAELARMLKSFMVRREKAQVLGELPSKRWQIITLPDPDKAGLKMDRSLGGWVPDEKAMEKIERQVIESPQHICMMALAEHVSRLGSGKGVPFDEVARERAKLAGQKLPFCIAHVRHMIEVEGYEKVVIMAHHQTMIQGLYKVLGEYNPVMLHGSMTREAKDRSVKAFQNDKRHQVFIGSTRAAGVGLTLTASCLLVFCEPDWVAGWMNQASDRCHRIGQSEEVLIQVLVAEGSLDLHMAHVIEGKRQAQRDIIDRRNIGEGVRAAPRQPVTLVRAAGGVEDRVRAAASSPYTLSDAERKVGRMVMRILVANTHPKARDAAGMSNMDAPLGVALNALHDPTDGQVVEMLRLAFKYRGQLPGSTVRDLRPIWERLAAMRSELG